MRVSGLGIPLAAESGRSRPVFTRGSDCKPQSTGRQHSQLISSFCVCFRIMMPLPSRLIAPATARLPRALPPRQLRTDVFQPHSNQAGEPTPPRWQQYSSGRSGGGRYYIPLRVGQRSGASQWPCKHWNVPGSGVPSASRATRPHRKVMMGVGSCLRLSGPRLRYHRAAIGTHSGCPLLHGVEDRTRDRSQDRTFGRCFSQQGKSLSVLS